MAGHGQVRPRPRAHRGHVHPRRDSRRRSSAPEDPGQGAGPRAAAGGRSSAPRPTTRPTWSPTASLRIQFSRDMRAGVVQGPRDRRLRGRRPQPPARRSRRRTTRAGGRWRSSSRRRSNRSARCRSRIRTASRHRRSAADALDAHVRRGELSRARAPGSPAARALRGVRETAPPGGAHERRHEDTQSAPAAGRRRPRATSGYFSATYRRARGRTRLRTGSASSSRTVRGSRWRWPACRPW